MDELIDETGTALMLITHDLGVVSEMTDRIAVMYAGRIVETGRTEAVFNRMAHPYARGCFRLLHMGLIWFAIIRSRVSSRCNSRRCTGSAGPPAILQLC